MGAPAEVQGVAHKEDDDARNPKKLFKLIEEGSWDDAILQCKRFPDQASKWIVRKDVDLGISWRRLPLHEACMRQPPEQIIEALLEAHPAGAQAQDHNGRLALHHACFHGASKASIIKLLMGYPESVEGKDIWGKTPLAVARASSRNDMSDVIEALSQKPLYYHIKKHETRWVVDQEQRMAALDVSIQAERDAFRAKIMSLEKQLESNTEKFLHEKEEYEEKIAHLDTEFFAKRNEYKTRITLLGERALADKESLEENISSLEKTMSILREEKEKALSDSAFVREQLEARTASEQSLKNENNDLSKKLENVVDAMSDLERKLKESENNYQTEQEKAKEQLSHLNAAKLTIDGLNQRIHNAEKEKLAVEVKLMAKISEFDDMDKEKQSLEAKIEKLTLELEEASLPVVKLKDEISRLEEEKDYMNEKNSVLEEKLQASIGLQGSLNEKVERYKKEAAFADLARGDFQKEAMTAKSEASCLVDILQTTLAGESALKIEVEEIRTQMAEAEATINTRSSEHRKEKESLLNEMALLKRRLSDLSSSNAELQEEVQLTRGALGSLEEKIGTAANEKENMVDKVGWIVEKVVLMKKESVLEKKNHAQTMNELERAIQWIDKLEAQRKDEAIKFEKTRENIQNMETTLLSFQVASAEYERALMESVSRQKELFSCDPVRSRIEDDVESSKREGDFVEECS